MARNCLESPKVSKTSLQRHPLSCNRRAVMYARSWFRINPHLSLSLSVPRSLYLLLSPSSHSHTNTHTFFSCDRRAVMYARSWIRFSISLSLSLLSLSHSVSLSLCLSLSLSRSLSLSLCLSVSLPFFLSLTFFSCDRRAVMYARSWLRISFCSSALVRFDVSRFFSCTPSCAQGRDKEVHCFEWIITK